MFGKLLTIFFITAISINAANEQSDPMLGCGTVLPQTQIDLELERIDLGVDYSLTKSALEAATSIPLTIHIVRSGTGIGGLSGVNLTQAMSDLNTMYSPMNISFYVCDSVDYIDDDTYYLGMADASNRTLLRQENVIFGTINIYFVPNSSGFTSCGTSSFTTSSVQGIIMNNACVGSSNPSTFAHEIGHYFDLYHTHETAFGTECPDGSNCESAGDLLCDTPADPRLTDHVSASPGCTYDNSVATPGGCSGVYNPQTENLMSYSLKPCRDLFTSDQQARAIYTLNNDRTELLPGCSPLLSFVSHSLIDVVGDGDGYAEAGESIELDVEIMNSGSPATNATGTLTSSDPFITITTGLTLFDATIPIANLSSSQTPFEIAIGAGCPDPYIAVLDLELIADGGYSSNAQIYLFIGSTLGFADNMESGVGFWNHYAKTLGAIDNWHLENFRSNSSSNSWKVGGVGAADYSDGTDAALVTPPFLLGSNSVLTFWHWLDIEIDAGAIAWDGGIVLVSDGSGDWEQIFPVGGYPFTTISNTSAPIGQGTPCYSGSFDWAQETFDLSAYSGVVQIMFQFGSDGAVTEEGWYVDDIEVSSGCANDLDSDGICDESDNCPELANPLQEDTDSDGKGDVCDGCCLWLRGNVDNDPGDEVDISDLVMLVDFIFIGGDAPVCAEEANVDGNAGGDIDISDLVVLVDFIFISGPAPAVCP